MRMMALFTQSHNTHQASDVTSTWCCDGRPRPLSHAQRRGGVCPLPLPWRRLCVVAARPRARALPGMRPRDVKCVGRGCRGAAVEGERDGGPAALFGLADACLPWPCGEERGVPSLVLWHAQRENASVPPRPPSLLPSPSPPSPPHMCVRSLTAPPQPRQS